jgi:AraC-like DNA-binding protein
VVTGGRSALAKRRPTLSPAPQTTGDLRERLALSPTPGRLARLQAKMRSSGADIRGHIYARATDVEREALEQRVADLVASGWTPKEIAERVHYSERHVRRIVARLKQN